MVASPAGGPRRSRRRHVGQDGYENVPSGLRFSPTDRPAGESSHVHLLSVLVDKCSNVNVKIDLREGEFGRLDHRAAIDDSKPVAPESAGLDAGQVIRWKSWRRWTAICLLAYIYLAVAVALQCQQDTASDPDARLIPVTAPELLRLLRGTVVPPPRRDRAHRLH